ncbi:energy transducer TonB [Sediminitomix flava]|uniref:TonB-like protein n=1 Tax=Sediminitomix flava TaxID=379075 RepID=A0A315Z6K1_SEDFL|nr:energy transducer TonB [Sediminitomix flava]PWJ40048.1 TonB-like protein [Sediminitomix flava]
MKYLLLFKLLLFSTTLFAQNIIYYDQFFSTKAEEQTDYSMEFIQVDSSWNVNRYENGEKTKTYFIQNQLSTQAKVERFITYIDNNLASFYRKPSYKSITAEISQYENGRVVLKSIYNGKDLKCLLALDGNGNNTLVDGNGIFETIDSNFPNDKFHCIYKDSVITDQYSVRIIQQDTIYNSVDLMATPKEGLQLFLKKLSKQLRYPLKQRLTGKEALIYITFIVDENGQLNSFRQLGKQNLGFEQKTIKKLSKLPTWNPAIKNGRTVKTRLILPIQFKLI